MEDRLIELETRFAFAEQTITTLNDIITRQQDQIDALDKQLAQINRRLAAALQPDEPDATESPDDDDRCEPT